MPAFGDHVTEAELQQIIGYIRWLRRAGEWGDRRERGRRALKRRRRAPATAWSPVAEPRSGRRPNHAHLEDDAGRAARHRAEAHADPRRGPA